jgi:5-formyltetrahydrofolate cyclo-ligase
MEQDPGKLKREMRRTLRRRRDTLAAAYLKEASKSICLLGIEWFDALAEKGQGISKVFAYMQSGSEVDLTPLLVWLAARYPLGVPRIASETEMEFRRWSPGDPTSLNRFNIAEPIFTAPKLTVDETTVLLIPALTADVFGYRLGYGGGFYDRYLEGAGPCIKVAVLYGSMMTDRLIIEAHDMPADFILTEDGLNSAAKSQS